jgi:transcriptional regulator with GAF, ATPase, and Fis domain
MDKKKDTSLLIRINKAISSIADNFELYETIFENLKSGYKFKLGGIAVYHQNNENAHVYLVRGDSLLTDPDAVLLNEEIHFTECPSDINYEKIQIINLDKIAQYKNLHNSKTIELLERFSLNEFIISPLRLRGKCIGHLILGYKDKRFLNDLDLELLQSISISLAIALGNTIAYQKLAQKEIINNILFSLSNSLPNINGKEQFFAAFIAEAGRHINLEYLSLLNKNDHFSICFIKNRFGEYEALEIDERFYQAVEVFNKRLDGNGTSFIKIELSEIMEFYPDHFHILNDRYNIGSLLYAKSNRAEEWEFSWFAGRRAKEQYVDSDAYFLLTLMSETAILYKNFLLNENAKVSQNRLEQEKRTLLDAMNFNSPFESIIGTSRAIQLAIEKVKQVAPLDVNALIQGETGTGKELIAYAIHEHSARNKNPFIKINCAALPAQLIESELFGHEKGSFTGAERKRIGKFELAQGGTIFLDEIGELPLELQAKLLRILQEKEFERVGGNEVIKTDVRVLAATNRQLEKEVDKGTFRADLFFRLNVFPINVPPLRERTEDIPILIKYFMDRFSKKSNKPQMSVRNDDIKTLMSYSWPGNVRELQNIIERAVIISEGDYLQFSELWFRPNSTAHDDLTYYKSLDEIEKNAIINVLRATNGKINGEKGAAKILGINSKTLLAKMKKYGIKKEIIIE